MTEIKDKAPDWWNMNLSELIDKSLLMGVVPMFSFLEKNKPGLSQVPKKSLSPMTQTPISVLEKEVMFYERMIVKLDNKDEVQVDEKTIRKLKANLRSKIRQFNSAIIKLKTK